MKTDFLLAITQLAAERNLPKEVVFSAVEKALVSAFKKDDLGSQYNLSVKIHPVTGDVKVYIQKTVVEEVTDTSKEIALADARKQKKDVQVGETVLQETSSFHAGRIAAQTAKQVVLQRLREAEREFIFGEYIDREGDIVSGVVHRTEPRQEVIDLGKAEGILPASEQVRTEHHRLGQRLKLYLLEVNRTNRGPRLILSRSHPNLVRRLFELEVPEIYNGIVEIKAVAREPGYRSKVAVAALQEGIDAVGSCVGLRGVRIQNVVNELNGERIDVIQWDADTSNFVANALSPAQVISVDISEEGSTATVVVADGQLSLAIGKEGQNARLAARLTGWKIDIKSASLVKAAKASTVAEKPPAVEAAAGPEEKAGLPVPEEGGLPLEQLGLSARTFNALRAAGFTTIEQVKARTDEEVLAVRNFGKKSLEELRDRLESLAALPSPAPAEAVREVEATPAEIETGIQEALAPAEEGEPVLAEEEEAEEIVLYQAPVEEAVPAEKPVIRFAEDIFAPRAPKGDSKKKGKKKRTPKEEADSLAAKKRRKVQDVAGRERYDDLLEE